MRNLIDIVSERSAKEETLSKTDLEQVLKSNGYENIEVDGRKLRVMVQIPDGEKEREFRFSIL